MPFALLSLIASCAIASAQLPDSLIPPAGTESQTQTPEVAYSIPTLETKTLTTIYSGTRNTWNWERVDYAKGFFGKYSRRPIEYNVVTKGTEAAHLKFDLKKQNEMQNQNFYMVRIPSILLDF